MLSEQEKEEIRSDIVVEPLLPLPSNFATTKHPFKYGCPFGCGKRYTSRSGLLSHKNTVHFQRKPYRCQFCNLHFFTSASRVGHIRKEHPSKARGLIRKIEEEEDLDDEDMVVVGEEEEEVGSGVEDERIDAGVPAEKGAAQSHLTRKGFQEKYSGSEITDDEEDEDDDDSIEEGALAAGVKDRRIAFEAAEESQVDQVRQTVSHNHRFPQTRSWIKEKRDQYVCLECGLSFCSTDRLIQHIETHPMPRKERQVVVATPSSRCWEENSLSCDLCSKTFCHQSWKKIHLKYHHPDAFRALGISAISFKCQFCYDTFHTLNHRRLHEALNCRKAKFPCSLCPNKFQSVSSYVRHIKETHKRKPSAVEGAAFQCPLCEQRHEFESPYEERFLSHLQEAHEGQVAFFCCSLCEYSNQSAKIYLEHLTCHPEAVGKRVSMYVE